MRAYETEETPRPWHLQPTSNGGAILCRPLSKHQTHLQVLTVADAQLIVRAVNSLDALVQALTDARQYVVGAYECAFPDEVENDRVLRAIDDAIAKANTVPPVEKL